MLGFAALEPKYIDEASPPFAKKNYKQRTDCTIHPGLFRPQVPSSLIPSWLNTVLMLLSDLMSEGSEDKTEPVTAAQIA